MKKVDFPKRKLLANLPTPIQILNFNGCEFFIKRDDFTGVELSGNKVRKLEYLLYFAKRNNFTTIFTCGGEQSNHSRATAIAAKSLGMNVKLFLWGKKSSQAKGNLFLDKFIGADILYLHKKDYENVDEIMSFEKSKLEKSGEKVFIIPEGGSSSLGIWGYINFIRELNEQMPQSKIKGILTAAGTGGTAAGLLVGAALHNYKIKIYAVNVLYSKEIIKNKIISLSQKCIDEFSLKCSIKEENLEILDGYSEEGYKNITSHKIKLIKEFAEKTGIILDPAYTGKAFYAYNDLFLKNKTKNDVLFLHTGGIFGAFAKMEKYLN